MGNWASTAIRKIEADFNRSSDTHLIPLQIPALPQIQLYFKDESTHPTGSLKHRLARSLFLYGLCNGWIRYNTTIIEASSGSTAVSEAYFRPFAGSALHRGDAAWYISRENPLHRILWWTLPSGG
jgi:cysteine synthase A